MKCIDEERIEAIVTGEGQATPEEEEHISRCKECAGLIKFLRDAKERWETEERYQEGPADHLVDETMAALAEGVLAEDERAKAQAHIEQCPACLHALAELCKAIRDADPQPEPAGASAQGNAASQSPTPAGKDSQGARDSLTLGHFLRTTRDTVAGRTLGRRGAAWAMGAAGVLLVVLAACVAFCLWRVHDHSRDSTAPNAEVASTKQRIRQQEQTESEQDHQEESPATQKPDARRENAAGPGYFAEGRPDNSRDFLRERSAYYSQMFNLPENKDPIEKLLSARVEMQATLLADGNISLVMTIASVNGPLKGADLLAHLQRDSWSVKDAVSVSGTPVPAPALSDAKLVRLTVETKFPAPDDKTPIDYPVYRLYHRLGMPAPKAANR